MAINNPALVKFFNSAVQRKFSAGEMVMSGEEPSGVMFIKEGLVQVYSISDEGDSYLHIIYKQGEMFPLIWAIKDIRRRVFYEAVTDVVMAEASKSDFLNLIKKDAAASYDVLAQLAEQFYIFADRLDNLQYKPARERVAYRLMFLASRFGERRGKSITIMAPLTHEMIAESINLARETTSREIENLEKSGLIAYRDRNITIKDIEGLGKEFSEPITLDLWGLIKD